MKLGNTDISKVYLGFKEVDKIYLGSKEIFKLEVSPNGSPSSLTATAIDASSVNLTWVNNATNQDGYQVFVSTDHVNFSLLETVTGKGNSKVIGGLS